MSQFPTIYGGGYFFGGYGPSLDEVPQAKPGSAEPNRLLKRQSVTGGQSYMPGFDKAPPWSLGLAWQQCKYPTLALAYTVTAGPIFAGTRTLELLTPNGDEIDPAEQKPSLTGNGTIASPADKVKRKLEQHFEPLWPALLNGLECLNYGFWTQEIVWDRVDGLTLPVRVKDFLPWEPTILYDSFGDFAGIRFNGQDRAPEYCLHHVHQAHKGRLHGYPRTENAREDWWRAVQSQLNGDRLENKASGISMLVLTDPYYEFHDATGQKISGAAAGQIIYNGLASGGSAWGPRYTFDQDAIEKNPALADHKPITAEQFDWGSTAQSILAQVARLDAIDTRIMRAYYRPEREAMQGLHGTMAEAGVHGQVGMTDSERCHIERVANVNEQTFATTIRTNGLPNMRWKATPLADPQRDFYQKLTLGILSSPVGAAEVAGRTDISTLLKKNEVPVDDDYQPLPALPGGPPGANGVNGVNGASLGAVGNDQLMRLAGML